MKKIILSLILFTTLFCYNFSVSTSDDTHALDLNPASLGIDRGNQNGYYFPIEDLSLIKTSSRMGNIGYSLTYDYSKLTMSNLFSPYEASFGFGARLGSSFYFGAALNKKSTYSSGLLFRPTNTISTGLVVSSTKDFGFKDHKIQFGISIRPITNRITIGADAIYHYTVSKKDKDGNIDRSINPFIETEIVSGIKLSGYMEIPENEPSDIDFGASISIALGSNNELGYINKGLNGNSDLSSGSGFGIYTSSQKKRIIKSKSKKKNFIKLRLDGLFIEEPPVESKFNFDLQLSLLPFGESDNTNAIQLRKWIEMIDNISKDNSVDGIVIDLGRVRAGFSKRWEMRQALERFKLSGKDIVVYSEYGINNMDYMLISLADKIVIPDLTGVELKGINIEVQFIKGLLDTLDIVPEVFRVNYSGKSYKTAADGLLYKKMSDEMRENYTSLFGDIFEIYKQNISKGRNWTDTKTLNNINLGPCSAKECYDRAVIDSIMYRDDFDKYLSNRYNDGINLTDISIYDKDNDYQYDWKETKKKNIAIIYAVGGIQSGESNPGAQGSSIMGDKTIMKAIKSARENKNIDAIVLRIDSGGGSALASDQMWKEVYNTTVQDTINTKPFIASMSDIAASGGYYIACQADTIVASPGTITGSIGVISVYPNISKLRKRFGITSDKIKFGDRSDFLKLDNRLSSDDEKEIVQNQINEIYSIFKDKVVSGRENLSNQTDMDLLAMGRVFTGSQAKNNSIGSLVDEIGGLDKAISIAKDMLEIDKEDEVNIIEYPMQKTKAELIKKQLEQTLSINTHDMANEDFKQYLSLLQTILSDPTQAVLPVVINID